jgi:GT2 family glycosyltransferase
MSKVLISVLNWNTSGETIACVDSILGSITASGVDAQLMVIDNGSKHEDRDAISDHAHRRGVLFRAEEKNLGFAGGHNIAIAHAAASGADHIWLVNSDATVNPETLKGLVAYMESHPRCGAASPLIVKKDDPTNIEFCGAIHQWKYCSSYWATSLEEAASLQAKHPNEFWIVGTAVMFRMQALKEVGPLNDKYFAYYEDDEICARLALAGWSSRVLFDIRVGHGNSTDYKGGRPDYYHYLMTRNHLSFWWTHLGLRGLKGTRLRLLEQTLFGIEKMKIGADHQKHRPCMLGAYDFLLNRSGRPQLERSESSGFRALKIACRLYFSKPMKKLQDRKPAAG